MLETPSFKLAVYRQGDANAEKLAIVIPGRLDTKDYAHNTSHVDFLASKGYYALSFDPPGTWESPGDISEYSTTTYLKVIKELIATLGNKPTLLVGHSRGGSVAMLASANPEVEGIVAVMASYGEASAPSKEALEAGYQLSHRDLPPGTSHTAEQKEFKLPLDYFTDSQTYDPAGTLRQFNKPKLLIYSDKDEFTQVKLFFEVVDSIPEPKTIYKIDCPHDYRLYPDVIEEVNRVMGEFLRKYLQ